MSERDRRTHAGNHSKLRAVGRYMFSPHSLLFPDRTQRTSRVFTGAAKIGGEASMAVGATLAAVGVGAAEYTGVALFTVGLFSAAMGATGTRELNQTYLYPKIEGISSTLQESERPTEEGIRSFIRAHQEAMSPQVLAPMMEKTIPGIASDSNSAVRAEVVLKHKFIHGLQFYTMKSVRKLDGEAEVAPQLPLSVRVAENVDKITRASSEKRYETFYVEENVEVFIQPDGSTSVRVDDYFGDSETINDWKKKQSLIRQRRGVQLASADVTEFELARLTLLVEDLRERAVEEPALIAA